MNNTADNLSTTTGSGIILEGKADKVRRLNGLITLLNDIKTGIQSEADNEVIVTDAYKALADIKVLIKEMTK